MVGGWRGRNDSIVQDKEAQVDMSGRFGIFCASDGRGPLRVLVDDQHRSGQKNIKERLVRWGCYDLATVYQAVYVKLLKPSCLGSKNGKLIPSSITYLFYHESYQRCVVLF